MREAELIYATKRHGDGRPAPRGWGRRHPPEAPLVFRDAYAICPGPRAQGCGVRIPEDRYLCRYCTRTVELG